MAVLEPTPPLDRLDRRTNWVLGLIAIVTVATLLGGLWLLPTITEGRDSSVAVRRSADVLSCRAASSAELSAAKDARDQATFDGLVASVKKDSETLSRIIAEAPAIKARIAAATRAYDLAIRLSQSDPAKFLEHCRR